MPGFDYGKMRARATGLLNRFAQGTVILTKTTRDAPDPATPWIPGAETQVAYTLDAVVKGVSSRFVDGSTILATDLEVTAADFGASAEPGDTLTIDGAVVVIIRDMSVPAAGTKVVNKWIVRA